MSSPPCVPLPRSTERLVKYNKHPGLMLDKYAKSYFPGGDSSKWQERVQKPTVKKVVALSHDEFTVFEQLFQRHDRMLKALGATTFDGRTVGSLTLHLARASALENAGICLHHVYGFAYLPGTGLKGMARAYAETVWFPNQYAANANGHPQDEGEAKKATDAWQTIEDVFGWSPGSNRNKPWKPKAIRTGSSDANAASGGVVFHDAWPLDWPKLAEDIVNCHFPKYYQGNGSPGDWDSPIPVYFLVVDADQRFRFALSKRDDRGANELIILAHQWLVGALTTLGAGAKTNAGYGAFCVEGSPGAEQTNFQDVHSTWSDAIRAERRADATAHVRLTTPAFLAGAEQFNEPQACAGCDLRPATVRGLLRWWWRTLHAGFLSVPELRRLEAAIWGDTSAAGAVRILIETEEERRVQLFAYRDRYSPKPEFKRAHQLGDSPNHKTTQGLFYVSYGMDGKAGQQRFYVEPGARWSIRLMTTNAEYQVSEKGKTRANGVIPALAVLKQAEAALWLLCHFGACGSKARKGFGSLMLEASQTSCTDVDACRFTAAELRQRLDLPNQFREANVQSAALGPPGAAWCHTIEVTVPSNDAWQVMDHIGFAYQEVAQHWKHDPVKSGLGLPRKIHGPHDKPLHGQTGWRRPKQLGSNVPRAAWENTNGRYASPVWIHVEVVEGGHRVRAIGLPAPYLPDLKESQRFLRDFLGRFQRKLEEPLRGSSVPRGPSTPPTNTAWTGRNAGLPASGDMVEAELLEERTKKGGWRAKHVPTGISGPIQNSADVPADKSHGERLQLLVHSANKQVIAFKYPTEQLLQQREQKKHQYKGERRPRRRP